MIDKKELKKLDLETLRFVRNGMGYFSDCTVISQGFDWLGVVIEEVKMLKDKENENSRVEIP